MESKGVVETKQGKKVSNLIPKVHKEMKIAMAEVERLKYLRDRFEKQLKNAPADLSDKFETYIQREWDRSLRIKDHEWAYRKLVDLQILKRSINSDGSLDRDNNKIYERQMMSLEPWMNYLEQEDLDSDFRIYVLNEILKLKQGANGRWYERTKNNNEEFPKFDLDTVNRVLPVIEDILVEGNIAYAGLIFDDLDEIKDFLDQNSDRQSAKFFKELFELIDEKMKPKEYRNIGEEFKFYKRGG